MRALDKIISFLFSIIMLIVSIVLILVGIGNIEPQMILDTLGEKVLNPEIISSKLFNPVTIAGIILFLASLKTTIFLSLLKNKNKGAITVKTKNGEISIAQDTIVNTARNATLLFDNVRDVQARMTKKCKGIVVYEIIQVYSNTNIRDLTAAIQEEVKDKITSTTGVLVKNVNIKIKNVYNGKKKESSEGKITEYVPVKQTVTETKDEVFNVDEAVEKMNDKKEVAEEVKEVVEDAGDTEVTKEE